MRSRVRLQAATSLLHLSTLRVYQAEINQYFVLIALTMQDSAYPVRMRFLDKLISFLSRGKIPIQYNMLPFLCVHDPEADVKLKVRTMVLAVFAFWLTATYTGTSVCDACAPRHAEA